MNRTADVLAMLKLAKAVAERDGLKGDALDYQRAHDAAKGLIEAANESLRSGCPCATCKQLGEAVRCAGGAA